KMRATLSLVPANGTSLDRAFLQMREGDSVDQLISYLIAIGSVGVLSFIIVIWLLLRWAAKRKRSSRDF
ncbi:MAG: hypothetical protein AAF517_15940, partial [Planctomycetota bacterium]